MYYAQVRWHFVSDDETWITAFHAKPVGEESVPDAVTRLLNNLNAKMYLGEEIEIDKMTFEPVEEGFVREWRPKK